MSKHSAFIIRDYRGHKSNNTSRSSNDFLLNPTDFFII